MTLCLRRCRLLTTHRIADSCTLKDRVERARIPLRSTTRDSLLRQNFAHPPHGLIGIVQLTDARNAALFLGIFDEDAPTMGVCLRVSPSVGSRAKLHSQLLEVVHSFARSLTDRFPFPLSDGHQHIQDQLSCCRARINRVTHRKQRPLFPFHQSTVQRTPKSFTERVNLSSLTTTTASAFPTSSIQRTAKSGRSIDFADTPSSR